MAISNLSLETSKNVYQSLAFVGLAYLAGHQRMIQYFPGASRAGLTLFGGWAGFSSAAIAYGRGTKCEEPQILDKVIALPIAAILSTGLAQTLEGRVSLSLGSCFRISIPFLFISFFFDQAYSTLACEKRLRKIGEQEEALRKRLIAAVLRMEDPEALVGDNLELSPKARAALNLIQEIRFIRTANYLGMDFINGCESISTKTSKTPEVRIYSGQTFNHPQDPQWWARNLMNQMDLQRPGELIDFINLLKGKDGQEYQQFAALLEKIADQVGAFLKSKSRSVPVQVTHTRTEYDL